MKLPKNGILFATCSLSNIYITLNDVINDCTALHLKSNNIFKGYNKPDFNYRITDVYTTQNVKFTLNTFNEDLPLTFNQEFIIDTSSNFISYDNFTIFDQFTDYLCGMFK